MIRKTAYLYALFITTVLISCSKDNDVYDSENQKKSQIENNEEIPDVINKRRYISHDSNFNIQSNTKTIQVNGEEFSVIDYGEGPVVLLLHGFPDSKELWRFQIPDLASAGYRVVAPDLRGYGGSPRSLDKNQYAFPVLIGDVLGIMDALGIGKANLVGHDFGSALAWTLAQFVPDRFDTLTALSLGTPGNPGFNTIRQRQKSWYVYLTLQEGLAEASFTNNDFELFKAFARSHPDLDNIVNRLSEPTALTTALNWYRGNAQGLLTPCDGVFPPPPPPTPKVTIPVMGVWSNEDDFLLKRQMVLSRNDVANTFTFRKIIGAGHWFMLERPYQLNYLLIDFLDCKVKDYCY